MGSLWKIGRRPVWKAEIPFVIADGCTDVPSRISMRSEDGNGTDLSGSARVAGKNYK